MYHCLQRERGPGLIQWRFTLLLMLAFCAIGAQDPMRPDKKLQGLEYDLWFTDGFFFSSFIYVESIFGGVDSINEMISRSIAFLGRERIPGGRKFWRTAFPMRRAESYDRGGGAGLELNGTSARRPTN